MFGSVVRIKVRIVQSRSKQFNVCEGVWGWDLDSGQSNQVEECLRVGKSIYCYRKKPRGPRDASETPSQPGKLSQGKSNKEGTIITTRDGLRFHIPFVRPTMLLKGEDTPKNLFPPE